MYRNRILTALFLLLVFRPSWSTPEFIQSEPLARLLASSAIGEVRKTGQVQVPFITWGGDIATIVANGDTAKTRSGSIMAAQGLDLKLVREDKFPRQLQAYLGGKSPYLRGTLGMITMATELLSRDPRTKPVVIYQMTWSAGGDALVVKPGIHSAADLKGKTIALQAYGPHVDYLTKILADAGLSAADVQLKWLPDLSGTKDSPAEAFPAKDVDAVLAIIPDALLLTSGGAVGTGAEGSVRGARILLSTKTANRIIADVYAVRSDYLSANRPAVEKFVRGLLQGEEKLRTIMAGKGSSDYQRTLSSAARLLLDSEHAIADTEGLYADAEFVGLEGNQDFFDKPKYPRSFARLGSEIRSTFQQLGLLTDSVPLTHAAWDFSRFQAGLAASGPRSKRRFDEGKVATVVANRQRQGTLSEGELFSFEIFFQPNQNQFASDLYADSFEKVIDFASTYGGALITVEGHSDPMAYLRRKKNQGSELELGRIKQSGKNLSLTRAVAVRDSLISFAQHQGIGLDSSQFAVIGHGIAKPRSGICGKDPCAPKTEKEWRGNMRVEFRIIQVEAESNVFAPL